MTDSSYIEIDHSNKFKEKQLVGGDTFISQRIKEKNRIISVLSDGLGSGVKANVLSTLTATMALNYATHDFDIRKTARVIMKTLPVCKIRKISYSTFTIVDIDKDGSTRIIEYDNPSYMLMSQKKIVNMHKEPIEITNEKGETKKLYYSKFKASLGDRIVLFSDGVTQSGIGSPEHPFGWGENKTADFIRQQVNIEPTISARDLSQTIVKQAFRNDNNKALDDITCGVIYFREPRRLLVMSGPPIDKAKDQDMGRIISTFQGKKIICGGTTANIIAREINQKITVDMKSFDREIPPTSIMSGVDLITEGTITLGKLVESLEKNETLNTNLNNGLSKFIDLLLNSDIIHFVVGTKINDAHQDPNVPVELEIRRNIFKRLVQIMEKKYLKETLLRFI